LADRRWRARDDVKTYHGTHQGEFLGVAPTGRKIQFETVDVMRVRNGKIAEHWGVANLFSLMQAARRLAGQARWLLKRHGTAVSPPTLHSTSTLKGHHMYGSPMRDLTTPMPLKLEWPWSSRWSLHQVRLLWRMIRLGRAR
jgi:hypothetical protein